MTGIPVEAAIFAAPGFTSRALAALKKEWPT